MMIDLDGFRQIKDAHGHLAGDTALVPVHGILQASCRKSDSIIRWGGDAFMIIGNTASPRTVEQLAERIRSNLADHRFASGEGHRGRRSGSTGFSTYPFSPVDTDSLTWGRLPLWSIMPLTRPSSTVATHGSALRQQAERL